MWYPKKILIKNLMSHAIGGYEFENGKAVMIHGINNYDDEQESNGSGKSAILEGIALAILGSPLRDASAKDLIRDGEDVCEVELMLWNSKTDRTMHIWRCFYSNTKASELELSFDSKIVGDMTSVRYGNEMILESIGITREDLLNYYLLSNERYVPFLKMSDTKKKEVIGRFSQADLVNPTIEQVDEEIDENKASLDSYEKKKISIESKIEVYTDEMGSIDLKEAKRRRKVKLDSLKEDVEDKKKALDACDIEIKDAEDDQLEKEKALEELPVKDFTKERGLLTKKETELNKELSEVKEEHEAALELQARVGKSLMDAVTCPKCTHEFSVADAKINIKKARKNKSEIDLEVKAIEEDITSIKKDIRFEVDERRRDLRVEENEFNEKKNRLKNALTTAQNLLERKINKKARAAEDVEEAKEILAELEDTPIVDGTDSYKEQIKELQKDLKAVDDNIHECEAKQESLEEEKATFVKFKTHLSNKAIGAIEAHSNQYLEKTGTDLAIQLDGYKMTKSKKVRENISATIYRNGEEKGALGKFSGGEKARIEIALIIAPQKLINMNCDSGGMDLLFLDEVIESVDSAGIGGIMKSLNTTGKTILVITHGTFDEAYPHMMYIEKESNGVSVIKS